MFPFDVILFDVGGVLLTNGWDHAERAAAEKHFGLDARELDPRHVQAMPAWECGEIRLDEYLDKVVFYEPRKFTREEFFEFMLQQSKVLSGGALGILAELSASNRCMVGALNNEGRETNDYRFEKFGLRRYFRVAFSSCYVGLRKPEPAIYRRALDILGAAPERVLFIDDREENVVGGTKAGMKAIQFTGEEALRAQLQDMGVLIAAASS
jgi:putative hydrolase of the HAD superfamily